MYGGKFAFQNRLGQLVVGRKFTIFALFYFVFEGKFQVQVPRGAYIRRGDFNGGFFALRFWRAYIWRGLDMEGLIFGILRYLFFTCLLGPTSLYAQSINTAQDNQRNYCLEVNVLSFTDCFFPFFLFSSKELLVFVQRHQSKILLLSYLLAIVKWCYVVVELCLHSCF